MQLRALRFINRDYMKILACGWLFLISKSIDPSILMECATFSPTYSPHLMHRRRVWGRRHRFDGLTGGFWGRDFDDFERRVDRG
ncbi:MAG: hypothetical protein CFE32_05705 [Alphaproteobacteria bacterium PA3]|nr:MAG: hypothetical protein CFE32_05705 [Alphaproteobacteria bacterium PA3]